MASDGRGGLAAQLGTGPAEEDDHAGAALEVAAHDGNAAATRHRTATDAHTPSLSLPLFQFNWQFCCSCRLHDSRRSVERSDGGWAAERLS